VKLLAWLLLGLAIIDVHVMVWLSTWPRDEGVPWIFLGFFWFFLLTTAAFLVSERAYRWLP
jgi:uncharacterized membrane protein